MTIFKATVFLCGTLPLGQNKEEAGMSQGAQNESDSYFIGNSPPESHGQETLTCQDYRDLELAGILRFPRPPPFMEENPLTLRCKSLRADGTFISLPLISLLCSHCLSALTAWPLTIVLLISLN